ncbi:MAG: TonB C-terminal domain-containing protein [candidate division KSB1 bacterium]|nr:TonB C-terminal domain-containing protein [candidate division KSB1 bacterium]MDZ7318299.1 TonB C-terminal domain-containing protein [candidate division KSB1 bacterium]MDZ7342447.1 TonB C-terminal domain-containing protein [candidate division KSB1 bacterium]
MTTIRLHNLKDWLAAETLQRHLLKITIIISLLIHLLFFTFYPRLSDIQLFPATIADLIKQKPVDEKRLTFELVETPENARQETPPTDAKLLSDKNSHASNPFRKPELPTGDLPYSEGDFDVKNLPQPPSASAAPRPGLDQPTNNRANDLSRDDNTTNSPAGKYTFEKFSRQKLMGADQSAYQNQTPDQPQYDNRKFSVDEIGGLSFNTYNWDFAPYMLAMKRKVERNVFPPPAFTHMGLISGETLLRFKVLPSGAVKDLEVLKYVGHESLKETSVQAILMSSPFKPLPGDFPEDYLEVTASFHYYVKR